MAGKNANFLVNIPVLVLSGKSEKCIIVEVGLSGRFSCC